MVNFMFVTFTTRKKTTNDKIISCEIYNIHRSKIYDQNSTKAIRGGT